jgi:hypothetical protein
MSADNWGNCPKCYKPAETKEEFARRVYGKVTVEVFTNALAEFVGHRPEGEGSLREDYELGFSDGKFYVNYRCHCACGFHYEFKRQNIEV